MLSKDCLVAYLGHGILKGYFGDYLGKHIYKDLLKSWDIKKILKGLHRTYMRG